MDEITGIVRKIKMDSGWEKIDKIRIHTKNKYISLNQSMKGKRSSAGNNKSLKKGNVLK